MTLQSAGTTSTYYRYGSTNTTASSKLSTTTTLSKKTSTTNTTTILPSEHKYNIGDKIARSTWTDGYYIIIQGFKYSDGEWLYVTVTSANENDVSYASVSYVDDNPQFYLLY